MFEEASGKKNTFRMNEMVIIIKLGLNQRPAKEIYFDLHQTGSMLWMIGKVKSFFFPKFLSIPISIQGFNIILMQFFTCELI